jgi:hypothetical protein
VNKLAMALAAAGLVLMACGREGRERPLEQSEVERVSGRVDPETQPGMPAPDQVVAGGAGRTRNAPQAPTQSGAPGASSEVPGQAIMPRTAPNPGELGAHGTPD